MNRSKLNSTHDKSRAMAILEIALFAVCICVLLLRATFTEAPPAQSSTLPMNLSDSSYSLGISGILIFSFLLYLVWSLCSGRLQYRPTGIEIALLVFCAAALISGIAASNKRSAITYASVLLAPPLMALLLVQILSSANRIRLLLAVITALAVVNVYQAADQFFSTNQMTINQYEEEPQTILGPLGIESDTLQHFLFEHRLYSQGARGYFTTRNSTGAFLLMSFFAGIILLSDKFNNRKALGTRPASLIAGIAILVVILFGLMLTKSKGAIIGLFFAAFALALYYRFGRWLGAHKKAVLITCLLITLTGSAIIIQYGLTHDRLPGGNSTLVRWQYWRAAAEMFADHPLTGVGPGNFGNFYPRYKPPAAPESVADPHNFILSMLSQFGPLGLAAFLAMIAVPLAKVTKLATAKNAPIKHKPERDEKILLPVILAAASAMLLLIRPLLMPTSIEAPPEVLLYVTFAFFIVPAAVFFIAFFMLAGQIRLSRKTKTKTASPESRMPSSAIPILFCALLAVAVHNLIDFAIFEPPVFTTFWALLACMLAAYFNEHPQKIMTLRRKPAVTIAVFALCSVTAWAYLTYAFLPDERVAGKIFDAKQAMSAGQFEIAHNLLEAAERDDPLSPDPPATHARFYLRNFQWSQSQDRNLLLQAEHHLLSAIKKDPATYKNFEKLTETYSRLAELPTEDDPQVWRQKALDAATHAVERYPGCGRLHLDLAQTAEQLGKTDLAITHYKRAIEIEDAYRRQFRIMYPDRKEIVSRLGNDQYKFATQKSIELSAK